jgi:hypothetical protein
MKKIKVNKTFFIEEITFLGNIVFDVYKEINPILNQDILSNLRDNIYNIFIKNE